MIGLVPTVPGTGLSPPGESVTLSPESAGGQRVRFRAMFACAPKQPRTPITEATLVGATGT